MVMDLSYSTVWFFNTREVMEKKSMIVSGYVVFKNYKINEKLQITFASKIRGECVICLQNSLLTHNGICGHLLCVECFKKIKDKCVMCRGVHVNNTLL